MDLIIAASPTFPFYIRHVNISVSSFQECSHLRLIQPHVFRKDVLSDLHLEIQAGLR